MRPALVVIAKAPVPGRSKTRLCPPCTPHEAASVAEACLRDTLAAVLAAPSARRVLVLDGDPGPWVPPGIEVVAQRGDGLEDRLANAFEDVGGPALLVGMDTPQVTPALLGRGLAAIARGARSVLGPATDGGYWAIGLAAPDPAVFGGIPMSRSDTGAEQLSRLRELRLDPVLLPALRDIDRIDDAVAVADLAPRSRLAARLAALSRAVAA